MNGVTKFKTNSNNKYFHSYFKRQIIFMHPLIDVFLELHKKGLNVENFLLKNKKKHNILSSYDDNEIIYYLNKFNFLKQNNYFADISFRELNKERLTEEKVEKNFYSVTEVLFEVTNQCNLECVYCCYGKYYCFSKVCNDKLYFSFNTAKKIIDQLFNKLNLYNDNKYKNRTFNIGFYGGEPLLGFEFIKKVTDYAKNKELKFNKLTFSMTTNGVVLDKYIDYLAENDFKILVSLDGNEEQNQYRVDKNGKNSFHKINRNLIKIRKKYPEYFDKNISFNSVSHNKNKDSKELNRYFKSNFDKTPYVASLTKENLDKGNEQEFYEVFFPSKNNDTEQEEYINDERFMKSLGQIYSFYGIDNYQCEIRRKIPTGTCTPFHKRLYFSILGNIYPCEKVPEKYALGKVIDGKLIFNYKELAEMHNNLYDKIEKKCAACYISQDCTKCYFTTSVIDFSCKDAYTNQRDFSELLCKVTSKIDERTGVKQ